MEWLERKKENQERILSYVMETKGEVFQEEEVVNSVEFCEISSKMKSEKFLLNSATFRNHWCPGHHRL